MTETYRPTSRSVIAALGVIALALGLLAYAPGAASATPPQPDTDGSASTAPDGGEATTAQTESQRLSGATRFQTAANIATAAYDSSTAVVIASGEDFADALAGAALEGSMDAPVLLVPSDLVGGSIPTAITDAIDDLGATSATLLGGTNAISSDVEDHIVDNSSVEDTSRVAGSTRFETAEQIAGEVGSAGSLPTSVTDALGLSGGNGAFLATGLNFADALAGGPGAFAGQHPILLTGPDELHPAAEGGLQASGADVVFILGGTAAVSADIESELQDQGYETVRLSGPNRWATAKEVADTFADDFGFGVTNVGLATGFEFADALASAPYLGNPAPLLLTPTDETHAATEQFFTDRGCDIETIDVFGGEAAVEQSVVDAYADAACPDDGEGPADTLTLTPQTATNPVDADHTVTADLSREGDGDVTDENVRFEVYPAGGGSAIDASVETTTAEAQSSFTYSSDSERDDVIVACTGSDPCVTGSDLNIDPATDEPSNIVEGAVADVALKSWETAEATALVLEPETATNTYGQDHTVTGTVVDQFGDPIEVTEDVTFEVFETTDGGDTWAQTAGTPVTHTTGADPSDDPDIAEPEAPGQASFDYTGPSSDAEHMIVACIDGANDCAEVQTGELGTETVATITESVFVDSGDKQWVAPEYSITLSQTEGFNASGTDHTYEGTVTNQFGDPAPSGVDVYSQVYRQFVGDGGALQSTLAQAQTLVGATDADGLVELSYTGPAAGAFTGLTDGDFTGEDAETAQDTLVACADVAAHNDCSQLGGGNINVNPAVGSDQLDKTWAPVETGVADGTYTGQALTQDRSGDTFVLRTDDDRFIQFNTASGSGNEFTVDGDGSADRDAFEMDLQLQIANSADHTVAVEWNDTNAFAASTWDLAGADLDGQSIASDFQDISGSGTSLGISTDDDACEQVQMPFAVSFYDIESVFLQVDTNGYLRVGQTPGGECGDFTNEDVPSGELGRAIAALWDDIDPGDGGTIYTQTMGSAPNRTFIVQYDSVEHFSESAGNTITFQVQIHEGSNDIEVHYQDTVFGDGPRDDGASATIGIQQSEDGPLTKYSFNESAIFDGEALRFNTN